MKEFFEQNSQAGGELSAFLRGRRDLDRFPISWKRVENFVVMPEGALTRRPGTDFAGWMVDSTRPALFMPFTFSETDAQMLVWNGGIIRFYGVDGPILGGDGGPYQIYHPHSDAALPLLRFWQQGDVVFCAMGASGVSGVPGLHPKILQRFAPANWTISDYDYTNGPVEPQNADPAHGTVTITGLAVGTPLTKGLVVTLFADQPIFQDAQVGTIWKLAETNLAGVPIWTGNQDIAAGSLLRRNAGKIYQAAAASNSGPNAPSHEEGTLVSGIASSGASYATWTFLSKTFGFVEIVSVIYNASVTVRLLDPLPPTFIGAYHYGWSKPAWSDVQGWPTLVHMHDQSLVWARGDRFWKTRGGDFYDFEEDLSADSGVSGRLTSPDGQILTIEYFLSTVVLIAGTRSGEFIIRGSSVGDALTPSSIRTYLDTTEGCAPQRVVRTDGGAFFVGRSRQRLHFAAFDRLSERITVSEITRYARSLLRRRIAQVVYQRDPHRLVWIRFDDGTLASIAFWASEGLVGISRHPLGPGVTCEEIGTLPGVAGAETQVWVAMRRPHRGTTRVAIERLRPFFDPYSSDTPTADGAWFLDCALAYYGSFVSVVSGLDHLEGESVAIFADGAEMGLARVVAGSVPLPRPAFYIIVGKPIVAEAETLPLNVNSRGGPTLTRTKQSRHVHADVFDTAGGEVRCNTQPFEPMFPTGAIGLAGPLPLHEGLTRWTVEADHAVITTLTIRAANALPMTLLAVAADLDVGA